MNVSNVIVFGDSDNDLSMFKLVDEVYVFFNVKFYIKDVVIFVIGYYDEDGIVCFLWEWFLF